MENLRKKPDISSSVNSLCRKNMEEWLSVFEISNRGKVLRLTDEGNATAVTLGGAAARII